MRVSFHYSSLSDHRLKSRSLRTEFSSRDDQETTICRTRSLHRPPCSSSQPSRPSWESSPLRAQDLHCQRHQVSQPVIRKFGLFCSLLVCGGLSPSGSSNVPDCRMVTLFLLPNYNQALGTNAAWLSSIFQWTTPTDACFGKCMSLKFLKHLLQTLASHHTSTLDRFPQLQVWGWS
jgi:hypothetical protein